jgi:hypothetical protein
LEESKFGTVLGILGLTMSLVSPFLPWVVTADSTLTLYQTGWWMAILPSVVCCSCGLTRYLGRRVKPIAFSVAGLVVAVENLAAFTTVLPTLGENSLALGFYLSLGSASLLLEGGIATYVEEGKKKPVSNQMQNPIVVARSCPGCGKDLSQFLPSLSECPFCGRSLSPNGKMLLGEKEVLVLKKRQSR